MTTWMCGSNDVYMLEFFQYVSQHSHLNTGIETNAILKYMRTIYRCNACRYKPETNRNIAIFPSKIH